MEPSNCSQHFKSFIFPFDISADKLHAKTDESAGHLQFLLLSKFNSSRRKGLYRHIIIYIEKTKCQHYLTVLYKIIFLAVAI